MTETPGDARRVDPRAELNAVLASTHDAVFASTPSGAITSWNPAAAALYGHTAEEVVGRSREVLIPVERQTDERDILRRVLRGEPAEQYHTSRMCKDGSAVSVSSSVSALVDDTGAIVGAMTVSRRVGEPPDAPDWSPDWSREVVAARSVQADAEQGLKDVQSQQAQRMEVLGQLAGGVAHDFNNLLGVIVNYAGFVHEELMEETTQGPGSAQRWAVALNDVEQIQRAVDRATGLTRQLLAFARREVIQPRVLNLNERVAAVEELLRRTIGAEMELITTLPTNLWPILADPGQIEQVLVNLAINARDAMPDGGVLRIDTANVDVAPVGGGSPLSSGRSVRLRVADAGTGMSDDVLAHAFEPFFTTKGPGIGTGLGLATVQGIVLQSGATITIESEPAAGTTFTIIFPATDTSAVETDEHPSFRRTPQGETILVVEDQEALRDVTQRILTRDGYRVITAANGPDAITIAENHGSEIQLLVTDVVMPKMLGKEVAERICEIQPAIKVLYMSGYAQAVLASQGKVEPGVTLVDKPFTAVVLLDKVAQVLNGNVREPDTETT